MKKMKAPSMEPDTLQGKGRKSIPYAAMGVLLARGLNFFCILYIVHNLSTTDWAIYSLFLGILVYLSFFSNLGMSGTLQRFIPEFMAGGHAASARRAAVRAFAIRNILILALLTASLLLFKPLGAFLNVSEEYFTPYVIFALAIFSFAVTEVLTVSMNAVFYHKWVALSQVALFLCKALGLVWIFRSGYGLIGVVSVEAGSTALSMIILFAVFLVRMPGRSLKDDGALKKRLPRMARFTGFNLVFGTGNLFLEPATALIIISHFLDKVELGLYAFAVRMNVLAFNVLPTMVLQSVVRPLFYTKYSEKRDYAVLDRMFRTLVHLNVLVLAPMFAAFFLFGESLVRMLKPEMCPAFTLLLILAFFNLLRLTELPADLVLQSLERVDIHCYSRIFSLAGVIGSVLTIELWGTAGVAVIFGLGMLAKNLFMYLFAKRYAKLGIGWGSIARVLINTGLAAACSLPFRGDGAGAFLGIGVFCAAYLAVSVIHRTFSAEQRTALKSIAPRLSFML